MQQAGDDLGQHSHRREAAGNRRAPSDLEPVCVHQRRPHRGWLCSDLNGDLDANDNDVTNDARVLPVIVTLTYQGNNGAVTLTHAFLAVGF